MKLPKHAELAKAALIALIMAAGVGALSGCEDSGFEEAGEELDEAADEVEDEL